MSEPPRDITRDSARSQLAPDADVTRLLDGITDYAIVGLGADGTIRTWNEGARRLHGYDGAEIVGKPVGQLSHEPLTDATQQADDDEAGLQDAAAHGRAEREGWRTRKDGARFWASEITTVLRGPDGAVEGFARVTRDLTERHLADERRRLTEERFRLLVERVRDYAIFMLGRDGTVVTWNGGAEHIKGFRADEIIGQHFSRFYPEEQVRAGQCEAELAAATRYGRFEDEGWRIRKDGTRFWANVVITALHDFNGELVGFAKVTRDLTERRKLEAEQQRRTRAEDAVRMRDEFLSIASHELKTPLTALQLQLQSLQRGARDDERTQKKIDRAVGSSQRLSNLIEALLDVSRIATGRFDLQISTFDLSELISGVIARNAATAVAAGCTVTLHAHDVVTGSWDRKRLEQAIGNVVANAIKYAAGTTVEISLGKEGEQAAIEVRDRGPGIPEEDLARIFDRFERAASIRHFGGLGLGLYVTRQIVETHGGAVTASNDPGGGARFSLRLPLVTPPVPPPAADADDQGAAAARGQGRA